LGGIYVKGQLVLKSLSEYDEDHATAIRNALKQMALKNDNKAAIKRQFGDNPPSFSEPDFEHWKAQLPVRVDL
jgi:hypothetical protein